KGVAGTDAVNDLTGKSGDFKEAFAGAITKAATLPPRHDHAVAAKPLRYIFYHPAQVAAPVAGIEPHLVLGNTDVIGSWVFGDRMVAQVAGVRLCVDGQESRLAAQNVNRLRREHAVAKIKNNDHIIGVQMAA